MNLSTPRETFAEVEAEAQAAIGPCNPGDPARALADLREDIRWARRYGRGSPLSRVLVGYAWRAYRASLR